MKTWLVFNDYIIYIQIMADKYKIPYVNMCIRLFARRFQMTLQGAADYLCKFKGIRFLDDCYPSEHLLPVEMPWTTLSPSARITVGPLDDSVSWDQF
ncbi:Protein of unknown function [Fibrobacter sp. UWOV1]|uniref:DUF3791 domain-containing protein n=1 Tax=Fibrobacter sp. UWOV1 TaxID=1896215 RepID=UPI00091566EA|nr:DUF3791 domain-containing protein [Fibrobacter sp. UWOV1]SHK57809.1 Protein of unknown function [Fibrobacter sp. UWOV1]